MPFRVFKEREVRKSILNKANPDIKNKHSKHWSGFILNSQHKVISRVKIPNDHLKEFGKNKAKRVAKDLQLNESQYNHFVDCKMTSQEYLNIVEE